MDGFGSGARYGGCDRRHEIVSGKSGNRVHSPDPGPIPPRAKRCESKAWSLGDPEAKRKKRIYKYKSYTVEGKVKASLRNGFRWIKNKCSEIVRGY